MEEKKLIQLVATEMGLPLCQVQEVYDLYLKGIRESMQEGRVSIQIKYVGKFERYKRSLIKDDQGRIIDKRGRLGKPIPLYDAVTGVQGGTEQE